MGSSRSNLTDVTVQLHHETPKAILVSDGCGGDQVWLAKSMIEVEEKGKGIVEVTLPEWLAIEKGLV